MVELVHSSKHADPRGALASIQPESFQSLRNSVPWISDELRKVAEKKSPSQSRKVLPVYNTQAEQVLTRKTQQTLADAEAKTLLSGKLAISRDLVCYFRQVGKLAIFVLENPLCASHQTSAASDTHEKSGNPKKSDDTQHAIWIGQINCKFYDCSLLAFSLPKDIEAKAGVETLVQGWEAFCTPTTELSIVSLDTEDLPDRFVVPNLGYGRDYSKQEPQKPEEQTPSTPQIYTLDWS